MSKKKATIKSFMSKIKEFNSTFGIKTNNNPTLSDKKETDLKVSLMQEELNEYKEAVENNDIVEIADALTDELYILLGKFALHGMSHKIEALFNEVHASNMSKTCSHKADAELSCESYFKKGVETCIVEESGVFVILRKEDGKVLKGINYFESDHLHDIF